MKSFLILIVAVIATASARHLKANADEAPIRHPDCPLNDDPQNPTLLAYPKDCTKFYKCLGGFGYPMACPAGLHWHKTANRCDWPELANCVPSGKSLMNVFAKLVNAKSDGGPIKHKDCPAMDDPEKPIHLPFPNDCSKFYKCSYGLAYPMDCPPGEHFGTNINRCDWPGIALCDYEPTHPTDPPTDPTTGPPTDPPTDPTTGPPTDPPTDPPTGAPTDPPTDPTTGPPTDPPTDPTTDPTGPTTTEEVPPGISCDNVPHGTLYPHPHECTKFIHCDHGVGVVRTCPNNLHFNPRRLLCDWPQSAQCTASFF